MEHLTVHLTPHLSPQSTLVVQLLQGVLLDFLEVIQVDVVLRALDCLLLSEFCIFEVVHLYHFTLLPRTVIDVINAMAEVALLSLQVA